VNPRFVFDLRLGGDSVKRVIFPAGVGRRELRTSGGFVIGKLVFKGNELRLDIDEDATQLLVDAQFHESGSE
jgi:hypothetical protein